MVADEDSGKEKKITQIMLVSAHDVKEAYDRIRESLNNRLVAFRIPEVIESNIVEIFPYVSDEDKEPEIPDNYRKLEPGETVEPTSESVEEEENAPVEEETE